VWQDLKHPSGQQSLIIANEMTAMNHRQGKARLGNILPLSVRGTAAALLAGVVVITMVVFVGIALPIWTMLFIYGTRTVHDSPGHGGIIFFVTVPIAALLGIPLFLFMRRFCLKSSTGNASHRRKRADSPDVAMWEIAGVPQASAIRRS